MAFETKYADLDEFDLLWISRERMTRGVVHVTLEHHGWELHATGRRSTVTASRVRAPRHTRSRASRRPRPRSSGTGSEGGGRPFCPLITAGWAAPPGPRPSPSIAAVKYSRALQAISSPNGKSVLRGGRRRAAAPRSRADRGWADGRGNARGIVGRARGRPRPGGRLRAPRRALDPPPRGAAPIRCCDWARAPTSPGGGRGRVRSARLSLGARPEAGAGATPTARYCERGPGGAARWRSSARSAKTGAIRARPRSAPACWRILGELGLIEFSPEPPACRVLEATRRELVRVTYVRALHATASRRSNAR